MPKAIRKRERILCFSTIDNSQDSQELCECEKKCRERKCEVRWGGCLNSRPQPVVGHWSFLSVHSSDCLQSYKQTQVWLAEWYYLRRNGGSACKGIQANRRVHKGSKESGSRICFTQHKKKKKKVQAMMMAACAGLTQPTFRFTCQLSSVSWSFTESTLFLLTAICSIDANPQSRSSRRHVSSMPKSLLVIVLHYANGCPLFRVRVMTVPSVYCDIIDAPTPPHKLTFWVKLIGLVPVKHSQSAQFLNWHRQRHRPLIDGLCIRLQSIQQERLNLLHLITNFTAAMIFSRSPCNYFL